MHKFSRCLAHARIHFYFFTDSHIKRQILEIIHLIKLSVRSSFHKKDGHYVD